MAPPEGAREPGPADRCRPALGEPQVPNISHGVQLAKPGSTFLQPWAMPPAQPRLCPVAGPLWIPPSQRGSHSCTLNSCPFPGRGAVEDFGLPRRGDLCQHMDSWGWRILEAVPHARPAFPVAGEPRGQLSPTPHSRNPAGTCPAPFPGYQGHLPHLAGHMAVLSGTGPLPLRGGGRGWMGHRVWDRWTGRRRASGADRSPLRRFSRLSAGSDSRNL